MYARARDGNKAVGDQKGEAKEKDDSAAEIDAKLRHVARIKRRGEPIGTRVNTGANQVPTTPWGSFAKLSLSPFRTRGVKTGAGRRLLRGRRSTYRCSARRTFVDLTVTNAAPANRASY